MEKIDLSALLGEPGATHLERIRSLEIEDETLTARLRSIAFRFTNASGSLRAEFEFEFEAQLCCVRCLSPFWRKGSIRGADEFELSRGGAAAGDEGLSEDGCILADGCFDICELARQTILTELPLVPICRDGCAGLCPECGANLNDASCTCAGSSDAESPLAAAFREAEAKAKADEADKRGSADS